MDLASLTLQRRVGGESISRHRVQLCGDCWSLLETHDIAWSQRRWWGSSCSVKTKGLWQRNIHEPYEEGHDCDTGFQLHPFPQAFLGKVLSAKEPHTQDLGTLPYSHAPALIQSSNTESIHIFRRHDHSAMEWNRMKANVRQHFWRGPKGSVWIQLLEDVFAESAPRVSSQLNPRPLCSDVATGQK